MEKKSKNIAGNSKKNLVFYVKRLGLNKVKDLDVLIC